jgi:hypothetical protein
MAAVSEKPPGASDHGAVLTVTSPAAELAGPGRRAAEAAIDAGVWPPSFIALSATSARFASGTTPAAIAVPPSEMNSAASAITSAGLGMCLRFMVPPCVGSTMAPRSIGGLTRH